MYSIGKFILDTERELLLYQTSKEIVSNHSRTVQLLALLAEAYPKSVSKNQLIEKLWKDEVSDWALSRQIYQLRQLLSTHDSESQYIKTVHAQGFKLEIKPAIINPETPSETTPEITVSEQNENPQLIHKPRDRLGKGLIASTAACLLLLGFFGYSWLKTPAPIYGEIFPKKTIRLPLNTSWTSSKPDSLQFTAEGIVVAPIELDPLFLSTSLTGPAFYQGAVFSIGVKLDQEFVNNKGGLRFYYQSMQGAWPGEWDCILDEFKSLAFEYNCTIDENGNFTKVIEKESVNIGVKLHQQQPIGRVTITSAKIDFPASISTEKGWSATNNIQLQYNRGVAYQVKSLADQLATRLKGPLTISGSKVAFTLEIDDPYKNANSGIQFFLINKKGEWQDCFIEDTDIQSNVFTKTCDFKNSKTPFFLTENEKIDIGIRPFGQTINGKITILGITVFE